MALTFKAGMKFLNKALKGFAAGFWSTYIMAWIDRFLTRFLVGLGESQSTLNKCLTVLFNVVLFVGQAAQSVYNMVGSLVAFTVIYWHEIVAGYHKAADWLRGYRTHTAENGEQMKIIDVPCTVVS